MQRNFEINITTEIEKFSYQKFCISIYRPRVITEIAVSLPKTTGRLKFPIRSLVYQGN